jgi:hypothetical protein
MNPLDLLTGGLVGAVGQVVDDLHTSDEEKLAARNALTSKILDYAAKLDETYQKELEAKRDIIVAELNQEDLYTKRGRPTILYGGLVFIGINYVLAPLIGRLMGFLRSLGEVTPAQALALSELSKPLADLPPEFWWAWGGVAGIYVLARSTDKAGSISDLLGAAKK